jgi:predicted restriction endonuclease
MKSYGLFDDHLLTIDTDYRVDVSTNLHEIADTPYCTPLQGQKLRLPEREELWPRQELLEGHWEAF